jgi:hypothetical protein
MSEHVQPFPGGIRRLHKKFRYAVHARFRGWLALPSRFHGQSFHKRLPIPVVPENRFPVITTVHDMVQRSRILYSQLSGHYQTLKYAPTLVNCNL